MVVFKVEGEADGVSFLEWLFGCCCCCCCCTGAEGGGRRPSVPTLLDLWIVQMGSCPEVEMQGTNTPSPLRMTVKNQLWSFWLVRIVTLEPSMS